MSAKIERARLLAQLFDARMPQLEAASQAQQKLTDATAAVQAARASEADATEHLRAAFDAAIEAGWTVTDLTAVGVTRPRKLASTARATSPGPDQQSGV